MSDKPPRDDIQTADENAGESRFVRLARALFGVRKADVEKHEPEKRTGRAERTVKRD